MKPPLFVRPLTPEEEQQLKAGLRSSHGFTVTRCQMVLASARRERPKQIATALGCSDQTVRNAIKEFEREGIQCLEPTPRRPKTIKPEIDDHKREQLQQLLHKSPRSFGKARGIWTLRLLADVCGETGITTRRVSEETMRDALK